MADGKQVEEHLCACGKPSNHESWRMGVTTHQCCECHIKSGGIPADWHRVCMSTYNAMKGKP